LFKESMKLLAAALAAAGIAFILYGRFRHPVWLVLGLVSAALLFFTLYFFRDPDRVFSGSDRAVLSPADGRVVEIAEVKDAPFLGGGALKGSIFLSVWDVHVNRIPIDGTVRLLEYRKGEFLRAYLKDASERNERMAVGIESRHGRFLVHQIAGVLARRIVCRLKPGDAVLRGARFGMIKFGSRTELFCPPSVKLRVSIGDKVKAGTTIIGELPDEQ